MTRAGAGGRGRFSGFDNNIGLQPDDGGGAARLFNIRSRGESYKCRGFINVLTFVMTINIMELYHNGYNILYVY
jgi:hypothetical protein